MGLLVLKRILGPALNGHAPFATCSLICVMASDCEDSKEGRSNSLVTPQESSGPTSSSDTNHRAAVSILDQLQAPAQSDLSRKMIVLYITVLLDCFPVLCIVFQCYVYVFH